MAFATTVVAAVVVTTHFREESTTFVTLDVNEVSATPNKENIENMWLCKLPGTTSDVQVLRMEPVGMITRPTTVTYLVSRHAPRANGRKVYFITTTTKEIRIASFFARWPVRGAARNDLSSSLILSLAETSLTR